MESGNLWTTVSSEMGMTLSIEARIAFRNFSLAGQHLATYIQSDIR